MEETAQATASLAASIPASVWGAILAVLFLLLLSGIFSGSETALTAASRARLKRSAEDGSKSAQVALDLTEDKERLIGAILLGNNLVNILATSLATSVFLTLFGESGVALATLLMTALVLIFSEVLPKTYAITQPEFAAERAALPISWVVRVCAPMVAVVRWIVRRTLTAFGVDTDPDASILAHEEIRGAIDLHHSEGAVESEARHRLLGALDLEDREVDQVMIHRRRIFMIDADRPTSEILDACLKSPFTRIPLYRGNVENIVGVIHAKDLLRAVKRQEAQHQSINDLDIAKVAMEPWFIPDTTSLADQLRAFLARRKHFALVVDEYGALQGLITLEDIIEEIVGDIADEHDVYIEGLSPEADGTYVVEGTTPIRDINRSLDWKLPEDEATTIAGLVMHEAQTIPEQGQIFIFHGVRFEILERRRHQIIRIRMKRAE
ncbi:MAG: HlyC/CorC family transporter [Neomegalonema sp.]|nr:HlyC/CorC family transporter [Neomegalonema sp.]